MYKIFKIVVMGALAVGKTALITKFIQNFFIEKYEPTIEDSYEKYIDINGNKYKLEIIDTTGLEFFNIMNELYINCGDGFIFVYSIISEASFEKISTIHDMMVKIREKDDFPCILCANKYDIENSDTFLKKNGKIMSKIWNCPFIKMSVKNNFGVNEAFYALMRQMIEYEKKIFTRKSKKKCIIL